MVRVEEVRLRRTAHILIAFLMVSNAWSAATCCCSSAAERAEPEMSMPACHQIVDQPTCHKPTSSPDFSASFSHDCDCATHLSRDERPALKPVERQATKLPIYRTEVTARYAPVRTEPVGSHAPVEARPPRPPTQARLCRFLI